MVSNHGIFKRSDYLLVPEILKGICQMSIELIKCLSGDGFVLVKVIAQNFSATFYAELIMQNDLNFAFEMGQIHN